MKKTYAVTMTPEFKAQFFSGQQEILEWVDPPKESKGRKPGVTTKWAKVDEMLRERHGEWALILAGPSHRVAPRIFAGPRYERNYRKVNGMCHTYVRFIGPVE